MTNRLQESAIIIRLVLYAALFFFTVGSAVALAIVSFCAVASFWFWLFGVSDAFQRCMQ